MDSCLNKYNIVRTFLPEHFRNVISGAGRYFILGRLQKAFTFQVNMRFISKHGFYLYQYDLVTYFLPA